MLTRIKSLIEAKENSKSNKRDIIPSTKPRMITLNIRNYHTTEVIEVSVDPNGTIHDLKRAISSFTTLPALKQCLVCKGKKLFDEEYLTYHGITHGNLVHLVVKDIEEMTLLVYCPGMRKMKVHLYNRSNVEDLRQAISKYMQNTESGENFKLMFHGTELQDGRQLLDYKLKNKAKIIVGAPA